MKYISFLISSIPLVFITTACSNNNHSPSLQPAAVSNVTMTISDRPNINSSSQYKEISLDKQMEKLPHIACELSYKNTANAVKKQIVQKHLKGVPIITLSNYKVFMKDCLDLPLMVQKCLVDEYAINNLKACQRARKNYDATIKKS